MNTILVILASLLTIASIGSGFAKLKKVPQVMESMTSVGVKPNQVPVLAVLEIAGGLGLVVGVWIQQLGLLASMGLSLYFAGAVVAHFMANLNKQHKIAEYIPAFALLVISVAVVFLQLQR